MSTQVEDLWPSDIDTVDFVTPVNILKQQASLLGKRTKNVVEARVSSSALNLSDFNHNLYLVAPALDHYEYLLLRLSHPVDLYPAELFAFVGNMSFKINSQAELTDALKKVFSDEKTKKIIQTLIAQSQN